MIKLSRLKEIALATGVSKKELMGKKQEELWTIIDNYISGEYEGFKWEGDAPDEILENLGCSEVEKKELIIRHPDIFIGYYPDLFNTKEGKLSALTRKYQITVEEIEEYWYFRDCIPDLLMEYDAICELLSKEEFIDLTGVSKNWSTIMYFYFLSDLFTGMEKEEELLTVDQILKRLKFIEKEFKLDDQDKSDISIEKIEQCKKKFDELGVTEALHHAYRRWHGIEKRD